MSGMIQPFTPSGVATIAGTTSTQAVALVGAGDTVLVTNLAANPAYVSFGIAGVTTSAGAGFPIPAGQRRLFQVGSVAALYGAALLTTGTGNVVFELGTGTAY